MYTLMALESRQHREAFTTLRARKGALGPTVAKPVTLETCGMAETFPALGADKRLLASVDALVLSQVAQIVEMPAAVSTLVATLHFLHRCPPYMSFWASQSSACFPRITINARGRTSRRGLQSLGSFIVEIGRAHV